MKLRNELEEKSVKVGERLTQWERMMRMEEDDRGRLEAENKRYIKELENRNEIEEKVNVYVKKLISHNEQLRGKVDEYEECLQGLGVEQHLLAQARKQCELT